MYVIYSVLIVLFFVVMSPSLIYQALRHRKYIGSLTQRLGYLPISFNLDSDESIWIHAVSVGEVLTARALLPDLRERYPKLRLFLSTTTMTGQQIARNNLQYVDIGAERDRVLVTGSLKFDSLEIPGTPVVDRGRNRVLRYFRVAPDRPVLVAASTVRSEEEPVLEAFQRIRATMTNALLIIAPRKPERFDDVEKLARRAGWNVARRTELRVDADPRHDVVILDTIGELAQLYQIATVVFVGGSLADMGGHNILEPAVFGKPIVFGPYMQNFAEISRTFLDNAAAVQIHSGRELESVLLELLGDPVRRARLGAAARALVEANRGARAKTLAAIAQVLDPDNPSSVVRPFRRV